jgi:hypothetical protein
MEKYPKSIARLEKGDTVVTTEETSQVSMSSTEEVVLESLGGSGGKFYDAGSGDRGSERQYNIEEVDSRSG